jgi:phosphoribosylanthranilate isomerase
MTPCRARVKLCGLRTAAQAALAAELGVEFIGLLFAERSRRRVTVEEARRVFEGLGPGAGCLQRLDHDGIPAGGWFERCAAALDAALAQRRPLVVGVFVDQPPSLVNAIAAMVPLDIVQLSGGEPWEQALEIHRPVIKAIHVRPETEAADILARCEVGTAALCMLDTAVAGEAGGTGRAFDWTVATEVAKCLPLMLAGGLDPENVGAAIARVRPWAVDVSSGIETGGVKDPAKMRAFVDAARGAVAGAGGEE